MNIKQFLTFTVAAISITRGLTGATPIQMNAGQVADAIVNKTITTGDTVSYDQNTYTLDTFDITANNTNNDYQCVRLTLKKPVKFLNIPLGYDYVSITVTKGTEPLRPFDKIENDKATNNKKDSIDVHCYRELNSRYFELKKEEIALGALVSAALYALRIAADASKAESAARIACYSNS